MVFATDRNTQLNVDTLYSTCKGLLEIGSQSSPIPSQYTAKVVFIDEGAVDDEKQLSRGAILKGQTSVFGAEKTHRLVISPHAKRGDSRLTLKGVPTGWEIDDQLVITGTIPGDPRSDEIRTINSISGNQIVLNVPLELDHVAPKANLNVYVANITRNIEFVSENTQTQRRGHIMFMHSNRVNVHNAKFTELGRTDKTRSLNDFEFRFDDDSAGDDAPETAEISALDGDNIRGRYALHFHQTGTDPTSSPAVIQGSVAFNGPGWGFVSHSSHVNMMNNVSYGFQGAGFYTEAGDEIGLMQGNIAIRSVNDSFNLDWQGAIDPDLRATRMDYGHDGDGFWLTGNQVAMIDNVSAGASAHGIIYWVDGIIEPMIGTGSRVSIPTNVLQNGALISGRNSIPVWWAPFAESRGNESYGATIGFRIRYVHAKNYLGREEQSDFHQTPSPAYVDTLSPSVNDLTVWGSRDGVLMNYNERLSLIGARIVGFGKENSRFDFNPGTAKEGIGLDVSNDSTHGPATVENITIEGFGMGFASPVNGIWNVNDMVLIDNGIDLLALESESQPTRVNFRRVGFSSFIDGDERSETLPSHINVIE